MKTWLAVMAGLALGAASAGAERGAALIKGTSEGSGISGTVSFEDTKKGLKIAARLSGVPAGEHGFHVHEFGSCEDGGKAAGSHYNPLSSIHGHAVKDGLKKAHAGDLGNIAVGADGKAFLDMVLPKVSLTGGRHSVAGRAVILHEKADDFGQPVGNAGGRIACGVVVIVPQ